MKNAIISIENKIITLDHFYRLYSIFEDLNNRFFNNPTIHLSINAVFTNGETLDFNADSKNEYISIIKSFSSKPFNEIVISYNESDIFKIKHSLNSKSKMYKAADNFTEISSANEDILADASNLINSELALLTPKTKILQYFTLISRVIISLQVLFLLIIMVSIILTRSNILGSSANSWFVSTLPYLFIGYIGVLLLLGLVYNLLFHAKVPTSIIFNL